MDVAHESPRRTDSHDCFGHRRARFLSGLAAGLAIQMMFVRAMRRRIGPEPVSPADLLTLCRATMGSVLAGLVVQKDVDRSDRAGRLAWIGTLLAATVTDWLDGPAARYFGATRLGGALDIEADSWLTLWSAAAGVTWGDLPLFCALPPLLRYARPMLALRHGRIPAGGDPWWGQATGAAQMALIVGTLAPFHGKLRQKLVALTAVPVSTAQLVTVVAVLRRETIRQRVDPAA